MDEPGGSGTPARTPVRRARLSDVAERAGVSLKTVSNVLNDRPNVSSSTRTRVRTAMADLGYRVNLSARALASSRTGFVALAIPGLDNPYYSTLAASVIEAAKTHGWTVLIEQTASDEALERAAVGGPAAQLVDGIILQPDAISEEDLNGRFAHPNLVLIGEAAASASADHVTADSVAAAREVTEHLLAQGRTRIATVGVLPRARANASELRYRGVSQAMERAGVPLRSAYLLDAARFRRPAGAEAADRLLALPEPPDAVICYNDLVASGLLARFRERGVDVPGAVAVVSFDDNEESRYTAPPLTSVSWDIAAIATRCVERLHLRSRPGSADDPPVRAVVGHRLVVRASSVLP